MLSRLEVRFLFWLVVLALGVTLLSAILAPFFDLSRTPFIQTVINLKPWALSFYFLYGLLAAVLVPIPTMPLEIFFAGVFGVPLALMVRLAASLAAAVLAFFLARRYGRPLLRRLFPLSLYREIDRFSHAQGLKAFLGLSLFPLINTEVMAYVAGLANLRLVAVLLVLALANFYRFLVVMLWGRQILGNLGL